MFKRCISLSLFPMIFLTPAAFAQYADTPQDRAKTDRATIMIGPELQSAKQFVRGLPLGWRRPGKTPPATGLEQAICKRMRGGGPVDCSPSELNIYSNKKGFAKLFSDSQSRIGRKIHDDGTGWSAECEETRWKKIGWHISNQQLSSPAPVPDSFGKIVHWEWSNSTPPSVTTLIGNEKSEWSWSGTGTDANVGVCTWIGDDEYYFEIKITKAILYQQHTDPADPFPNTLDLTMLDPGAKADMIDGMKQWHYKLHAKRRPGAHDMEIKKVVQNGIEWSMSEVMMLNHDNMCFDIFFKLITEALLPLPLHSAPLPAQQYYCMGRCDARILNTR